MKRKLITLFSLVLVAAVLASCLVGCSFFQENDFRVANETYVTVKHNGITLNISYNEILDYCNSSSRLYSYVNYYGLSVAEALDLCIQGKIQSTYLLAEAMGDLTNADKTSAARIAALYGQGKKDTAEQVLTYAERAAAIFAVNESIDSSLESYIEELKEEDWTLAYNKIESNKEVKEVVLTDATLTYLDKFFNAGEGCLVGDEINKEKIVAKVIYADGTESAEYVVPTEGYSVEFDSAATSNYSSRTEDKNFTVCFTEVLLDDEGEEVETEHTYVYDYKLIYPRTVKTEAEEATDYSKVTIDEVKVNRYASEAELATALNGAVPVKRDVQKEYDELVKNGGEGYKVEAYEKLLENLESGSRTMDYIYKSQFETMANTAVTEELYLKAETAYGAKTEEVKDAEIVKQFKYLYNNQKNTYNGNTTEENRDKFVSTVTSTGTGMDTLYYRPEIIDLDEYFFVKQVLFKFDTQVVEFLETLRGNDDEVKKAMAYFMSTEKTLASNPDYDAEFECPLHALKEEGATCSKSEDDAICPSVAFVESEENIKDVIARIEGELNTLYGANDYEGAKDLFEKYLYTYCDDAGSFNANWGYLIAKEEANNSWVKDFTKLAKDLYAYKAVEGNAFTADGTIGVSYTYSLSGTASSDYAGVSIMMISKTPFNGLADAELTFADDAQIIAYLKANFNGEGISLYDAIKDGLVQEARSLAYSDYIKIVTQDIYERDEENNKITLNKDYKGIIEIKAKKIKKNIYDLYVG